MTLQELCDITGKAPSTIQSHFASFVKKYEKETGNTIVKTGRGATAAYDIIPIEEKRMTVFYAEKGANNELFLDNETIKLPELMLRALLGVIVRPNLVYRGTYRDFLTYIDIRYTDKRKEELKLALNELAIRGYIYGGEDSTNRDWFLVGLTRRIEKKMGVGIERIKKCKQIAEDNHKQSWVPILKVWIAKEWLSDRVNKPITQKELAEFAGLSIHQVKESTSLLSAANLIHDMKWYEEVEEIDEDGNVNKVVKRRVGTLSKMNGLLMEYYEPIDEEMRNNIKEDIKRPFG
jgi:hypothetical protein